MGSKGKTQQECAIIFLEKGVMGTRKAVDFSENNYSEEIKKGGEYLKSSRFLGK